jgi:hypothetical protein
MFSAIEHKGEEYSLLVVQVLHLSLQFCGSYKRMM